MEDAQSRFRFNHIPALDGLRGIALLMVFCVHTQPVLLRGGQIGVDLFFVLSGFLITSILLKQHESGSIHLGHFYLRRVLRLFPAMFTVVALCVAYSITCETPAKLAMTLGDATSCIFYYWNWRQVWDHPNIASHQWMLFHLWSLSVEEQFYIIWPPLLAGLLALRLRWKTMLFIVMSGIVVVACNRAAIWAHDKSLDSAFSIYFRTDTRADALLFGVLVALAAQAGFKPGPRMREILKWGSLAAAAFVVWDATRIPTTNFQVRGQLSLVAASSACVIASVVWCKPAPLRGILELAPLRWVGRISYGLYLYHWPIFYRVREDLAWQPWLKTLFAVSATFAVATVSFYFLETPFLRLKDRLGYRQKPETAGSI